MGAERVSLPGRPKSLSSWPDTPLTEGPTVMKSGANIIQKNYYKNYTKDKGIIIISLSIGRSVFLSLGH